MDDDLYAVLGVGRTATQAEIKRAYRTLRAKLHPDKSGGREEAFKQLVAAYECLSDPRKRAHYDATGEVQKSVGEEFVESFASGAFTDRVRRSTSAATVGVSDQITLRQQETATHSHTAGFEAWLRGRGTEAGAASTITADTIAERYGVVRGSYDAVPLPPGSALAVVCRGAGKPQEQCVLVEQPLPPALEWGEVLIAPRFAPLTADVGYSLQLGGVYGDAAKAAPFVAGHDCVAVVAKVGPGVKDLAEGDVVLSGQPLLGTFTDAAVVKAKHIVRVGRLAAGAGGEAAGASPDAAVAADELPMPLEYLAISKELALAYRLLEAHGGLKPGDCVILNAPDATVGRTVLQLCRLLKLRSVAVLRRKAPEAAAQGDAADAAAAAEARWEATAERLRGLGATLVLRDEGSLKTVLAAERFFGRPRLALDAVGGASAVRLADALEQGGHLVVYGCLSGQPLVLPWQAHVFRGLTVTGFNVRADLAAGTPKGAARLAALLASLGKLVAGGLLSHDFAEYALAEWDEALSHALDAPGGARVLLCCGSAE